MQTETSASLNCRLIQASSSFHYFSIHLFSAIECPEVELPSHSVSDKTCGSYQDELTVYCRKGYWFEKGVTSLTMTCQEEGTWDLPLIPCIGKHFGFRQFSLVSQWAVRTTSIGYSTKQSKSKHCGFPMDMTCVTMICQRIGCLLTSR